MDIFSRLKYNIYTMDSHLCTLYSVTPIQRFFERYLCAALSFFNHSQFNIIYKSVITYYH